MGIEGSETPMEKLSLGIVTAPGLANQMSTKVETRLTDYLNQAFYHQVTWEVQIEVDQITGAAESAKEIMDQAVHMKKSYGWNLVISLTDLPIFHHRHVVLADVDLQRSVAQISLPSLGIMPSTTKVKKALIQMTYELYYRHHDEESATFSKHQIGIEDSEMNQHVKDKLQHLFKLSSIHRETFQDEDGNDSIRFLVYPKASGVIKLLFGMTMANNPLSIMPSFKKVIGLAFATGSYMLIFNTLWQLSGLYGYVRFFLLMATAIVAMISWIIIAHNLWEKKSDYHSQKLRHIYNATTITTLTLSVLTFYASMFLLFSIAVLIFVPEDIFKVVIEEEVGVTDYLRLAWLVTSAATVAGAIGAGLEDEESVRKVTYGYRQYIRSLEIKEQEKREEQEEEEGK